MRNIFRRERGLEEKIGKLNIFDPEKQPDIAEKVKANFIKVPEVSSPVAVSGSSRLFICLFVCLNF